LPALLLSTLHKTSTITLDGASYAYDNAGNRTTKANKLNNVAEQYVYDAIYQLQQVTHGTSTTESYTYDAVGNRLTSLSMPSYGYNSSNELTSATGLSYTYDNNGNTLSKTSSGALTQYTWDFENKLSSAILPGSGGTVTFKYDPFGRRIQKSSSGGTTNYLYDGANSIEEINSAGAMVARYTQANGVDEPLAQIRSGATSYYEEDGLGSVTSLSNSTGSLANTYLYDSFGNLSASTGTLTNPFQYTGRDYDPETGLRYYRARYYDPAIGRFINEDPIGLAGGPNLYAYVGNGPTQFTDPDGTQAQAPCKKSCGLKTGPEYNVTGAIAGGSSFHWSATFLNDNTHDPKCCEVRQLISWNHVPFPPPHAAGPHGGFQPPRDQPNQWYEDRDDAPLANGGIGTRYGRRTGPYVDKNPNGSWPYYNKYGPNNYYGEDQPAGWPAGFTLRFRLIVVDVCNRGKTIYTSKTISDNF
jgi:RHS repeat-associated protein